MGARRREGRGPVPSPLGGARGASGWGVWWEPVNSGQGPAGRPREPWQGTPRGSGMERARGAPRTKSKHAADRRGRPSQEPTGGVSATKQCPQIEGRGPENAPHPAPGDPLRHTVSVISRH